MFFQKTYKKRVSRAKIELRYKFVYWAKFHGLLDEMVTHKLDYIPESWFVVGFSSLQNSWIYDTHSLAESAYADLPKLPLSLTEMQADYDLVPASQRNVMRVQHEYARMFGLKVPYKTRKESQEFLFTFNGITFLHTNRLFVNKRIVRKKRGLYRKVLRTDEFKNRRYFSKINFQWRHCY